MNPALAAIAIAVVAAGVLAVTARDVRAAVLGMSAALVLAPLVTASPEGLLPLAVRIVGAVLAAYLLSMSIRGADVVTGGSALGWPAEALAGGAAAVAGYAAAGLGVAPDGPPEAQAAGLGLLVLAAGPLIRGRDALRQGIGLVLLVLATVLVRSAIAGPPSPLEEVVWSGLIAGVAATAALIVAAARSTTGTLELAELGRVGARARRIDAHPMPAQRQVAAAVEAAPEPGRRFRLGRRFGPRRVSVAPPAWAVTWEEGRSRDEVAAEPVAVAEPEPEPGQHSEPAPVAEPVAIVEPEPAPLVEPEHEPVALAEPKPEPAPVAEPEARPEPVATVAPEPAPEPSPVVEPVPEPEPVGAVEPEPTSEPEPAPPARPEPAPEAEPATPRVPVAAAPRRRVRPRSVAGRGARIMPPPEQR